MAKDILFASEAREKVVAGINKLANAVKITLGAKGRNVLIDKGFAGPTITNDGVTIAKEIDLVDKYENIGAQLIKDVAVKTNDTAGDGTTTATILAQVMINDGLESLKDKGINAVGIRRGIDKATSAVIKKLQSIAKPIDKKEDISKVATISANDVEIGEMMASVFNEIGPNGVITIETSDGIDTEFEFTKGMHFDQGWASHFLVTDANRMQAVTNDPYIMVTDKEVTAVDDILPILEQVSGSGNKGFVIIAEDFGGEALPVLVVNKLKGMFNLIAVKAPGFGDRKKQILQDIAAVTGATLISEETGIKLSNTSIDMLGRARRVISGKDWTTIVDGAGKKEDIDTRIAQINTQLKESSSDYDREKLRERLAKLTGGVAVIKVGGATEIEQKERHYRVEDAKEATRAAIEEGIVAGGGVALMNCADAVDSDGIKYNSKSEEVGRDIVKKALTAPILQILENAAEGEGYSIENLKPGYGFNVETGEIVDMIKAGIIDPVKVTRLALKNAASVAGTVLTTEAAVANVDEETDEDDI